MEPFDADKNQADDQLGINYIEFPAQDFDAIQAFYEKAFGWRFVDYGPEYRAFNDGSLDGGFYKSEWVASSTSGGALVVFYSNNLEKTLSKIENAGGSVIKTIYSFPGGRRFHFGDPNGNEYAVWSAL